VGAVMVLAAWWRRRGDHRNTTALLGGALAVVAPFVVARAIAWRSVPAIAASVLGPPPQAPVAVRLLVAAAIAVPAAFVLRLALPERRLRTAATATAAALGAIAAHLTAAGLYSQRLAWPIAIAFAITLVIELVRSRWSGPSALITLLVLCLIIYEGREAPGRLRWSHRVEASASDIDALRCPAGEDADPYRGILARIPAGATVAVWVTEPQRLDYVRHRIIDLRVPAGAHLRERRTAHPSRLVALLAQLSAAYLLVESDRTHADAAEGSRLSRFICGLPLASCTDELEAVVQGHHVVSENRGVRLVDLRR